MGNRFYIVEMIHNPPYRSPKYFGGRAVGTDPNLSGIVGYYNDYGIINQCLVYVPNIDPAHEVYLDALPDVLAIPENLEQTIGAGRVQIISDSLEARGIPGNWINSGDTVRRALREICWYFDFTKRLAGKTGVDPRSLDPNALNLQFGNLSGLWRTAIIQSLTELGIDSSGITDATTVRQILRALGTLFSNRQWRWKIGLSEVII